MCYCHLDGELLSQICSSKQSLNPCIFEYVYFARPDSVIDGISVYDARLKMGKRLGEKVKRLHGNGDVDVVIPVPDSSRPAALELAMTLNIPYREGFIKNRYIGRTFIMPGQGSSGKIGQAKIKCCNHRIQEQKRSYS